MTLRKRGRRSYHHDVAKCERVSVPPTISRMLGAEGRSAIQQSADEGGMRAASLRPSWLGSGEAGAWCTRADVREGKQD